MKINEILKEEFINRKFWASNGIAVKVLHNNSSISLFLENEKTEVKLNNFIFDLEFKLIEDEKTGWEDVELGYKYYTICYDNSISTLINFKSSFENKKINSCNMFSTKEKAEEVAKEQLLYRMMKKFRDENDEYVDWNNKIKQGYYILLCVNGGFSIEVKATVRELHTVYFTKKELAQKCLDEIVIPFMEKEV